MALSFREEERRHYRLELQTVNGIRLIEVRIPQKEWMFLLILALKRGRGPTNGVSAKVITGDDSEHQMAVKLTGAHPTWAPPKKEGSFPTSVSASRINHLVNTALQEKGFEARSLVINQKGLYRLSPAINEIVLPPI